MVALGTGGARRSEPDRETYPALGGLCRLPLVPRHGARELRGPGDGIRYERALREHKGRPRRASGDRRDLYECPASARRAGRLASDYVPNTARRTRLGRHLFPQGLPLWSPRVCRRAAGSLPRLPRRARKDRQQPQGYRRASCGPRSRRGESQPRPCRTRSDRHAIRQLVRTRRMAASAVRQSSRSARSSSFFGEPENERGMAAISRLSPTPSNA